MTKREEVIEVLKGLEDKDFDVLIKGVEGVILDEEKAKYAYKNFEPARGTLQQYREAEQKWKFTYMQRNVKLTAFFEMLSGKNKQFVGRSFVRRPAPQGKIHVNEKGALEIADKEIRHGDRIEIELNGVWVPVTVVQHEEEWYAKGIKELSLLGKTARITVGPNKEKIDERINEKGK